MHLNEFQSFPNLGIGARVVNVEVLADRSMPQEWILGDDAEEEIRL
jgi:hypothetical protein